MGLDFKHTIEIDQSAKRVFAYLADFENNPRWQSGMQSCCWTSAQRSQVGASYVQQARFLGRRIDTHFRVTALEPGRAISIESTQSTFPIQVTRSVEAIDAQRCRVTAHIRGQPHGILKFMGAMVKRSVKKDYLKLKQLLESR